MTTYVDGGDGLPQCTDCADGECITTGQFCEDPFCYCGCRLDAPAERARQLDQRPYSALVSIARDLEAEARPSVADLVAERFRRR